MAESWMLAFPAGFWILPIVAAVFCMVGFKEFVWFMSVGYGFAIAGLGAALFIMYLPVFAPANLIVYLQCLLLVAYGIRLGGYVLYRELHSAAYRKTLSTTGTDKRYPFGISVGIWVYMSILYCLEVSPLFYRLANGTGAQAASYIGFAISVLGVVLESVADKQKSAAKKASPGRFCDTGTFKLVRCPNYLGELVIWTGMFVSGIGALTGFFQWLFAILGYGAIIYIMLTGAKRLEKRQDERYLDDPEYRAYTAKTPILIPFVPLYSLKNASWIRA